MNSGKRITWLITIFILILVTNSCQTIRCEKLACPIENIFIDVSDLPGDQWEEIGSRSYRDAPMKLGNERSGTSFSTPLYGIVIEQIYRFKDIESSESGFNEIMNSWNYQEPEGTLWTRLKIPNAINATEYRVECSIRSSQTVRSCWYVSRYKETIIRLKADMIIISDEDLFYIIQLIDDKVNKCTEAQD